MSLVGDLEDWHDPKHWDEEEEPSEEMILRQFVYSIIATFVEKKYEELDEILHDPEGDHDRLALTFVDEYAAGG